MRIVGARPLKLVPFLMTFGYLGCHFLMLIVGARPLKLVPFLTAFGYLGCHFLMLIVGARPLKLVPFLMTFWPSWLSFSDAHCRGQASNTSSIFDDFLAVLAVIF